MAAEDRTTTEDTATWRDQSVASSPAARLLGDSSEIAVIHSCVVSCGAARRNEFPSNCCCCCCIAASSSWMWFASAVWSREARRVVIHLPQSGRRFWRLHDDVDVNCNSLADVFVCTISSQIRQCHEIRQISSKTLHQSSSRSFVDRRNYSLF